MGRRSIVALAALAMLAAVVLPGARTASAAEPSGLVFKVGVLQGTAGLDIAHDSSALANEIWTLQYPRLTEYDENDLSPVPGIADSWSPSPDRLTYTYHLRDGLTWSNGRPVTPADVVASINNARTQHWPGTGTALDGLTARVVGTRSVAVHTTRLDLRLPVIPVHVVPQGRTDLAVGSGPFVVTAHDATTVRMQANDRYWAGRPGLSAVEFHVYTTGDALTAALESGAVDGVSGAPTTQFNRLNSNVRVTTITGNNGAYYALALDTHTTPFSDVRIRKALGFSIDRALLVQQVMNGVGRAATTPTVARSPQWDFSQNTREQLDQQLDDDAGSAAALLKSANVGRIDIALALPPNDPVAAKTAAALGAVLQGSAFHVAVAPAKANARVVLRDPADDPNTVLQSFTCSGDGGWWCNTAYDRQYAAQSKDIDPAGRTDTVLAMKRVLVEQAPEVPLFHPDLLEAYRSDRWQQIIRQPEGTGPVFFTASSPNFLLVQQAPNYGSDQISAQVTLLAIVAVIAFVVGVIVVYFVVRGRGALQSGQVSQVNPVGPASGTP